MDETTLTSAMARVLPAPRAIERNPLDVSTTLESMWERVGGELLARVATLEEALAAVHELRLDDDLRGRAEHDAHRLAGSAGTFGRHEASSLARQLEELFADPAAVEPGSLLQARRQLEQLRVELSRGQGTSPLGGGERCVLLIVHRDSERAAAVGLAAEASGFDVRTAGSLEAARRALGAARPAVALVDLALPGGMALQLVAELVAQCPPVATLAVTGEAAFTDRVEAVRIGVRGFVPDSLPPAELAGAAAAVVEGEAGERCQLVAVDDDPAILAALRALLEPSGFQVRGSTDAQQFWAALEETAPDLAVLDLNLPGTNGFELCQLLRADPRWAALPLVVLTAKADRATLGKVFEAGADDYVVKPFLGPELLTHITNRLERIRILRAMAEVDPLTGLANRRKLEARLARLQAMADRYGQPLSFALLDLDRFRSFNNRHGHDVGDAVLRQLAGTLSERFHGEDVVCRWGGDEIALVLYGMTREDGVRRVDEALEEVSRMEFRAPCGDRMRISFSAGVSEYRRDGGVLRQLYLTADEALHRAKALGRGSILPAGSTT